MKTRKRAHEGSTTYVGTYDNFIRSAEGDDTRMRRLCRAGTAAYAEALERAGYLINAGVHSAAPELSESPQ